MKKFKTLASIALVVVMMIAMMLPASAGTISVPAGPEGDANATPETYTAYKIFDVTKSEEDGEVTGWAYSIETASPWFGLLQGNNNWVSLVATSNGAVYNVSPKQNFTSETQAKDFATYLLNSMPFNAPSITLTEGDNVVEDGYYLITSSLGSGLALCTTDIPVNITEKNEYPTLTKDVDDKEAQIGDILTFTMEVTVPATATGEILVHDKMESSLTFRGPVTATINGEDYRSTRNTWLYTTFVEDECTFELQINADNAAVKGQTIVFTYQAMLNQNAEICPESNDNVAWLEYSEYTTEEIVVPVKSFKLGLNKVDDTSKARLEGAEFQLFTADVGGEAVRLVDVSDEYELESAFDKVYRVAEPNESFGVTTTIVAGQATVKGLDSDVSYYLEETKAPSGYNKLNERVAVSLTTGTTLPCLGQNADVTVENSSGRELPSTGGMGTTIFYCIGGIMVAGAFVLLVAKKRMGNEA